MYVRIAVVVALVATALFSTPSVASAHGGVRFQLSSASEAGTYVRYHGPDGIIRSQMVMPRSSIVYPAGGHLVDVRVKWGWTISGLKNGSPFRFTCNRVSLTYDGTYCRQKLWGSYVARYYR